MSAKLVRFEHATSAEGTSSKRTPDTGSLLTLKNILGIFWQLGDLGAKLGKQQNQMKWVIVELRVGAKTGPSTLWVKYWGNGGTLEMDWVSVTPFRSAKLSKSGVQYQDINLEVLGFLLETVASLRTKDLEGEFLANV